MGKRQYTDEEKGEALAVLQSCNGNASEAADLLGIPRQTLQHWAKGETNSAVPIIGQEKKESLADKLEGIAYKLADAMPDKIEEATLQQIATSIGITIDKMRLLREEPTNISKSLASPEARMERLNSIFDAAAARRSGHDPANGQPGSDTSAGGATTVH